MLNWKRTSRSLRALSLASVTLVLAVTHVADAARIYAKAWLAPHLMARAYAAQQQSGKPSKPWPWADTYPVARLEIPRLGVKRFVLQGDSGHAMAFGAGMAEGVRPGEPGLVMISGHRDTHFKFLEGIENDDAILLSYGTSQLTYRVITTVIADATDGYIPALLPAQGLLLVTCFPFDALIPGGSKRYVIVAERLWSSEIAAAH
ncbi:MAG: class GN sortase [Pseudomonadota bacterium]